MTGGVGARELSPRGKIKKKRKGHRRGRIRPTFPRNFRMRRKSHHYTSLVMLPSPVSTLTLTSSCSYFFSFFVLLCNGVITVQDILIECADLLEIRKKYFEERSLYSLFQNVIQEIIFDFLREIGVFYKIRIVLRQCLCEVF